jgi:hypothetical protein
MNVLSCVDMPSNIPGIDYDLINKYKLLFNDDSLNLTNLKFIKHCKKESESSDTEEISKELKINTSLKLDNDESDFDRLIPPYIIPCEYNKIDGCIKKSAFTKSNKYYCWIHRHCYK